MTGAGAQDGQTPPVLVFDMQRAFHVFNLVANWAYSRLVLSNVAIECHLTHHINPDGI